MEDTETDATSRCRVRAACAMRFFSFITLLSVSGSVEKSTRLRLGLSKYQKGRALGGTRARKSRLFSRSTPMLFLPFVGITSPVCSPPPLPSPATRVRTPTLVRSLARSLVYVKICRVCAHVRIMRTRIYQVYTYVHVCTVRCMRVRDTSCALDHPPVHPLRKLGVVLSRQV